MYCIVLCRCTYMCMYISMYVCMYSICRCIMYMFIYIRMYVCVCICVYIQYNSLSNSPVSTWVSIYILLVDTHTPHSVPSSCHVMPCQPLLVVSTSDEKYRFGVPFKVLSKLDYICSPAYIETYVRKCVCMYVCI